MTPDDQQRRAMMVVDEAAGVDDSIYVAAWRWAGRLVRVTPAPESDAALRKAGEKRAEQAR